MTNDFLDLSFEYDETLGFYQWEKKQKQKLIVNIRVSVDIKKAAQSDHLDDTIDYDEIDQLILNILREKHYHLIETFADKIAHTLHDKWPKSFLEVTVNKPMAIKHARKIAVIVKRNPS